LALYLIPPALAVKVENKNLSYPLVWHVPHRNENFIGRSNELKYMVNYFQESGVKILPLTGRGGIGKTQLAKQFAHSYKQNYDIVWWFDDKKDLAVQIKELAKALNSKVAQLQKANLSYKNDEAIIAYVKDQLRTNKKNWLLIFDDVKDLSKILPYLPEKHVGNRGHVIIISRNDCGGYKAIKLNEFLRHDSMKLIDSFLVNEMQSEKEKLAILFSDYPLAIAQAISYIKTVPGLTINDYLQLYNSERIKLWEKEQQILSEAGNMNTTDNYSESAAVALSMTMQEIKNKNEQAFKLLRFCSILDNENIPLSVLRQYITDKLVLNEALAVLVNHNILELKSKEQGGDILYRMHEMMQLVVQDKMNIKEKTQYISNAITCLNNIMPTKTDKLRLLRLYIFYNVDKVMKEAINVKFFDDTLMTMQMSYLGFILGYRRDYQHAQHIINICYDMLKLHKYTAISNLNMVKLYIRQSLYTALANLDHQESINFALQAYQLLASTKNIEDAEKGYLLILTYNRLVQSYYFLGQLDEALRYSNMTGDLIKNLPSMGYEEVYYHARSRLFIDKGQFEKALLLSKRAMEIVVEKSNSLKDMAYFPVYVLQCQILLKLDKYQEAYIKLLDIYHAAKKFYDGQHPYLVITLALLADAENRLGNVSKAEKMISKALALHIKVYNQGVQNRYTAYIHTVHGDIYAKQNKYDKAEEEYLKAEEIYKSALKNIRIDDVSSLYIKIAINAVKRKDPLVTKYYFNLHKEIFGEEHPRNFDLILYLTKNGLPMP
jgi:tetratricopeptide (TPR) repeat protein